MSKLAELLKTPPPAANPANIRRNSNIRKGTESNSNPSAEHADRLVEDIHPLSPAQEAARQQVLRELEANPSVRRAFCSRFSDGNLIITLAIRGVGTGELLIPAERFNQGSLDDYAALLDCLKTRSDACVPH